MKQKHCIISRGQALAWGRGAVSWTWAVLWAVFCWIVLGPGIGDWINKDVFFFHAPQVEIFHRNIHFGKDPGLNVLFWDRIWLAIPTFWPNFHFEIILIQCEVWNGHMTCSWIRRFVHWIFWLIQRWKNTGCVCVFFFAAEANYWRITRLWYWGS